MDTEAVHTGRTQCMWHHNHDHHWRYSFLHQTNYCSTLPLCDRLNIAWRDTHHESAHARPQMFVKVCERMVLRWDTTAIIIQFNAFLQHAVSAETWANYWESSNNNNNSCVSIATKLTHFLFFYLWLHPSGMCVKSIRPSAHIKQFDKDKDWRGFHDILYRGVLLKFVVTFQHG
jgi:hypothetical protein